MFQTQQAQDRMAGGLDTAAASSGPVSPAAAGGGARPSYLKSYPYLFVRETDQTDYFCTVCEECLKEDQLQSHLFETHSAENLQVMHLNWSRGGRTFVTLSNADQIIMN